MTNELGRVSYRRRNKCIGGRPIRRHAKIRIVAKPESRCLKVRLLRHNARFSGIAAGMNWRLNPANPALRLSLAIFKLSKGVSQESHAAKFTTSPPKETVGKRSTAQINLFSKRKHDVATALLLVAHCLLGLVFSGPIHDSGSHRIDDTPDNPQKMWLNSLPTRLVVQKLHASGDEVDLEAMHPAVQAGCRWLKHTACDASG